MFDGLFVWCCSICLIMDSCDEYGLYDGGWSQFTSLLYHYLYFIENSGHWGFWFGFISRVGGHENLDFLGYHKAYSFEWDKPACKLCMVYLDSYSSPTTHFSHCASLNYSLWKRSSVLFSGCTFSEVDDFFSFFVDGNFSTSKALADFLASMFLLLWACQAFFCCSSLLNRLVGSFRKKSKQILSY